MAGARGERSAGESPPKLAAGGGGGGTKIISPFDNVTVGFSLLPQKEKRIAFSHNIWQLLTTKRGCGQCTTNSRQLTTSHQTRRLEFPQLHHKNLSTVESSCPQDDAFSLEGIIRAF